MRNLADTHMIELLVSLAAFVISAIGVSYAANEISKLRKEISQLQADKTGNYFAVTIHEGRTKPTSLLPGDLLFAEDRKELYIGKRDGTPMLIAKAPTTRIKQKLA